MFTRFEFGLSVAALVPIALYITALTTNTWSIAIEPHPFANVNFGLMFISNTATDSSDRWIDDGFCGSTFDGSNGPYSKSMCHMIIASQACTIIALVMTAIGSAIALFNRDTAGYVFFTAAVFGAVGFGLWNGGVHTSSDLTHSAVVAPTTVAYGFAQVLDIAAWVITLLMSHTCLSAFPYQCHHALALASVLPIAFFALAIGTHGMTLADVSGYGNIEYGVFFNKDTVSGSIFSWTDSDVCGTMGAYPVEQCRQVIVVEIFTAAACFMAVVGGLLARERRFAASTAFFLAAIFAIVSLAVWNRGVQVAVADGDLNVAKGLTSGNVIVTYGYAQVLMGVGLVVSLMLSAGTFIEAVCLVKNTDCKMLYVTAP